MSEQAFDQIEPSPGLPSKGRRLFRAFVALIFSLIVPGLGQIYSRRPYRGLLFGVAYLFALFLQGALGTLKTPKGFAIFLSWSIGVGLLIVADSTRWGWKKGNEAQTLSSKLLAWGAAIVLVVFSAVRASDWYAVRYFDIRAFKVPSRSMCPTICEGDRMIVDTSAFKSRSPGRGDIIVFRPSSGDSPYIKRVIGIAGDVIKQGPSGSVVVNGSPLSARSPQKESPVTPDELALFDFPETHVPAESFFVLGDNLGNSLDSRVRGFGLVETSQLIGRPLFLYWSSDRNRIGREIH